MQARILQASETSGRRKAKDADGWGLEMSDAWVYGPAYAAEERLRNMVKERDFLLLQLERLEGNIQAERRRMA